MTNENSPAQSTLQDETISSKEKMPRKELLRGNREIVTDLYIGSSIENERNDYAFKVYIRLNGRNQMIRKVSFQHSVFDGCYFNSCTFDSCDFTGCRFVGCNFHQSSFAGCDFRYVVFERCQIDADILQREAPREENLKMRFARSLRMNFQQMGDAKAVNQAISLELEATEHYLKKSWSSKESYYHKKYSGWKKLYQFLKWIEFKILDFIWGNGESIIKLIRSIFLVILLITLYDVSQFGNAWDLKSYIASLTASPGIFFGIANSHQYPVWLSSAIAATRLIGFAFLTAILVKRFGRR
ncbi:pentapeptide repeat-containing protein [Paraburkholderia sp. J41]|uniref:pentapeptide repeat-containing protein n=1 Tax=Paraburkholderia sp. J41 TaxID=2805433 RepID=UPI002AC35BB7|nr:pentapeptide repeat-containing protein [Paraburkholderia sp. J41]